MSFLRRVASPACVALMGLSLLFVVPDVRAQEEEPQQEQSWDRWTPELQMRFRAIGQTAMSPDGSLVAYTVRWPEMEGEDSEYRTHIWLASTDGSRKSQFTRGEESASSPSFSPDGEFLAFTTSRSGDNQVWVMPVSGGEAWQVTQSKTGVAGYRWSPDGSRMAFTARDEESDDEEAAKKEKRYVIRVDQDFKYGHLYLTEVGDGAGEPAEATRLTEGEFHVTAFTWAPDGARIAFSHQPDPRLNTGSLSDLSIVAVSDGEVVPLVNLGGTETTPSWSPGGDWIAFVGTGDQAEPIGLGDIYIVRPDGSEVTRLADTPDRTGGIQAWSMDGADVLVTQAVGVGRHLVRVPADGSPAATVTSGDGVYGSFSFASDADAMAFTYQEPELPADVHVATRSGADDTRLTEVNAGVPLPEMGRTEVLRWTSDDGTPVEGLLTYPVGYEEGRRYPLILNVHGGPAGVFSRSFTGGPSIYMLQSFAQDGYAVLRPNPRGSTGYGKEFRYANFQDWGFGDYDDLDSGVDLAIEMGVAHADSLLLMGWSYGGYMTSFAVTRTDRFRAASMGAGLPNLISMITTTDIQDYLAGHMGGEYWEDYEMYERHSAIYQLDKIVTPMQVIHGERDLRVPFTQGQEFYRALSRKGVPTEMIVLPRTPHGPREPKLLMSVQPLIKEWFEKYLRPVRITSDEDGAGA